MSTPRQHHYIPQFYLAAWTNTGTTNGTLLVIDKHTGKTFHVKPINIAKEKDLYMIDLSEVQGQVDEVEIETTFGMIEGAAAPLIKRIVDGHPMPHGEDRENILAFLALLALRVPSRLEWFDEVLRKPLKTVYQRLATEGALAQPVHPAFDEKISDWLDRGLIKINIKQNARLAMMISALPTLLNLLARRRWTVVRAQHGAGDLICTDHPVLLEWTTHTRAGSCPGFGLDETAVFVPLSPSVALLGLWNTEPKEATLAKKQITFWNGELLGYVERFVFSRDDFAARHSNGTIDQRADVVRRWVMSS